MQCASWQENFVLIAISIKAVGLSHHHSQYELGPFPNFLLETYNSEAPSWGFKKAKRED
jgi:hypothetical protein